MGGQSAQCIVTKACKKLFTNASGHHVACTAVLLCGSCSWLRGCRLRLQLLYWRVPLLAQMCDFLLNPFLALCWVAAGVDLASQLEAAAAALATQLPAAELLASANRAVQLLLLLSV